LNAPRELRCVFLGLWFCIAIYGDLPAQDSPRVVHVFVALADNQHQGIVPVPPRLGNGEDPEHNLYWGAAAGVKTYFRRSPEWDLLISGQGPTPEVLERCLFKRRDANVYLVADAYRGSEIRRAIVDFFNAAAGASNETINVQLGTSSLKLAVRGGSSLLAYVGHDGLMDFALPSAPRRNNQARRDAIILACASKQYFADALRASGANPLLWTTGLMAPEAYTLKSALDGWIAGESAEQIRDRAAAAYDKYQKCGLKGARHLFTSGW